MPNLTDELYQFAIAYYSVHVYVDKYGIHSVACDDNAICSDLSAEMRRAIIDRAVREAKQAQEAKTAVSPIGDTAPQKVYLVKAELRAEAENFLILGIFDSFEKATEFKDQQKGKWDNSSYFICVRYLTMNQPTIHAR